MKISLEIHPSFLNSCYFELIERALTIHIHTPHFMINHKIEDRNWAFDIDEYTSETLITLTKEIIKEARPDSRLILDGVSLKCGLQMGTVHNEYNFRCPEPKTKELELAITYFNLMARLNTDSDLNDYLELLEEYFAYRPPIKEFDEEPYRLRIYGALSIYEKESLTEALNRVSVKENLLLDLRNFQRMGTALHECFEPLKGVKNLRILANESAFDIITNIGFSSNQIERVQ